MGIALSKDDRKHSSCEAISFGYRRMAHVHVRGAKANMRPRSGRAAKPAMLPCCAWHARPPAADTWRLDGPAPEWFTVGKATAWRRNQLAKSARLASSSACCSTGASPSSRMSQITSKIAAAWPSAVVYQIRSDPATAMSRRSWRAASSSRSGISSAMVNSPSPCRGKFASVA